MVIELFVQGNTWRPTNLACESDAGTSDACVPWLRLRLHSLQAIRWAGNHYANVLCFSWFHLSKRVSSAKHVILPSYCKWRWDLDSAVSDGIVLAAAGKLSMSSMPGPKEEICWLRPRNREHHWRPENSHPSDHRSCSRSRRNWRFSLPWLAIDYDICRKSEIGPIA